MADKKVSTLKADVVTTLVTALANGITQARNSGNALADFCAAALGAKLPTNPPAEDVSAIVDALASKMAWDGTSAEKVRKSEARAIVRAHAALPEGITAMRAATGACGYHEAVRVAREINQNGGNASAAVATLTAPAGKKKADHDGKILRALQSYWNALRDSKRKDRTERMAIIESAAQGLKLTLKTA